MYRNAMKVVVELQLRAVSCPGVHLPAKDDIYLSVCFMSQYCKSECLPPVFPLLFREKMRFEKVFHYAVDPGDVAEMLECETVKVELVQLIPPVGEALACFEEDSRRFLFPEPKLVPSFSGVDREVLMTRSICFPGIAPRLEFSTRTTISECSANARVNSTHLSSPMRTVVPKKRTKRSRKGHRGGDWDGARRAPVMPRSRSLSPYKASQMDSCHGNMGRLAQLSLGSSWDIDEEFLPHHKSDPWLGTGNSPTPHLSPVMARPTLNNGSSPRLPRSPSSDTDNLLDYPPGPSQRCSLANIGGSPTPRPSMLWRSYRESSRQNGSHPSSQGMWEEVQHRVRGLLTTPRAVHRLTHGATDSEIDEVLARRSISPNPCPP
ncbi:spermatogenesis associated 6-like protein [Coregonus clupeaformis]|uniref:spermatogenesis associated 6-like protein n=1 Tax=Coregonus clupeaformis TaxID=59861 RepID=UPI001BE00016|nr:spermatogenesis associated 6-like protein [Coregonus clupeaformis]XP_041738435.1 spermatogenesis associated 6-like protein [Coregonus clupeaformis]